MTTSETKGAKEITQASLGYDPFVDETGKEVNYIIPEPLNIPSQGYGRSAEPLEYKVANKNTPKVAFGRDTITSTGTKTYYPGFTPAYVVLKVFGAGYGYSESQNQSGKTYMIYVSSAGIAHTESTTQCIGAIDLSTNCQANTFTISAGKFSFNVTTATGTATLHWTAYYY